MPRPSKKFSDPKKQKAHMARLAQRRAAHSERRGLEIATQVAEGQADFAELVEAEKQRIESSHHGAAGRKGAAKSPKIMAQAREDLARAFDLIGGVAALVVWGRSNATDFYRLWAKLIPATAQAESSALPLEELLEKLATREEMTVRDAAVSVGEELLAKGRKEAEAQDAMNPRPEEIN